jgi:hypothetical protein
MSTNYTTTIPETDCIGDSLATINSNFDNLGSNIEDIYDGNITKASGNFTTTDNLSAGGNLTASTVKTNIIQNTSGTNLFVNGYPRSPGQIIEYLSSPCDGSSVTVGSGTYTFGNVTTTQILTDTLTDITGSTIVYTPPEGTTRVIYSFNCMVGSSNIQTINAWRLLVDGIEIAYARRGFSAHSYLDVGMQYDWTFAIGGVTNNNTGRYSTWTAPKTIKLQARKWPGSYASLIHSCYHYPGIGDGYQKPFMMPTLNITAIA